MHDSREKLVWVVIGLALMALLPTSASAQDAVIVPKEELADLIPSSLELCGRNVAIQMRNTSAVRFEGGQHLVAAIQDGTGYGSDVAERYTGILIAELPIRIGDSDLGTGTYGFGFGTEGIMNVFDLKGEKLFSVEMLRDEEMSRPRPLAMIVQEHAVRLYRGKDYVTLSAH